MKTLVACKNNLAQAQMQIKKPAAIRLRKPTFVGKIVRDDVRNFGMECLNEWKGYRVLRWHAFFGWFGGSYVGRFHPAGLPALKGTWYLPGAQQTNER